MLVIKCSWTINDIYSTLQEWSNPYNYNRYLYFFSVKKTRKISVICHPTLQNLIHKMNNRGAGIQQVRFISTLKCVFWQVHFYTSLVVTWVVVFLSKTFSPLQFDEKKKSNSFLLNQQLTKKQIIIKRI